MCTFRARSDRCPVAQSRHMGLLALALLFLSACAPGFGELDASLGWLEASSPKKLEVDRAEYRHVTYFATNRANLDGPEGDRLIAFIRAVRPSSKDSIRITGHADERATDLYNLDLAARRLETIKDFLAKQGVDSPNVQANSFGERSPVANGNAEESWQQNRRVEIIVERYLVTPPACPDWSRRSGVDFANAPHSNFGCATETNLGLMVANPRDLVRGRSLAPADGTHQAEGIVRYRESQQPELQEERVN